MSKNNNKPIFGKEVLINTSGQLFLKKRFLNRFTTQFYRFFFRGS